MWLFNRRELKITEEAVPVKKILSPFCLLMHSQTRDCDEKQNCQNYSLALVRIIPSGSNRHKLMG